MKNNIVTVIGARPQFIKAATVSQALTEYTDLTEITVHTGQHYSANMSDIFFDELNIRAPDYNLGIGSSTHGIQTGKMLAGIEAILLEINPQLLITYGDTNSTLAGALAAAKLHIPIAHIEAGLRSFNRQMPEEVNRIMTDHLSALLFCPTAVSYQNACNEGIDKSTLFEVGDVMYDAALIYGAVSDDTSKVLMRLNLLSKDYLLLTLHRAENTDNITLLTKIVTQIIEVAKVYKIILPIHPRTEAALKRNKLYEKLAAHIQIIEPVGYLDMIMLEKNAAVIITDSGGVQKEGFFHQVPCIILREQTEWTELVDAGWNVLVPQEKLPQLPQIIEQRLSYQAAPTELYGAGIASQKIAKEINRFLKRC